MLKVSLIVPVYNVESYLNSCINSILIQTYQNFELILINDGSLDGSGEICDFYAKKDNRITVIHKQNEGVSTARNIGLSIAKGEYIVFIDSDDFIHRDLLKTTVRIAKDYLSDIVIFQYQKCFQNQVIKQPITSNVIQYSSQEAIREMLKGNVFRGIVWNKLYKASKIRGLSLPINRNYGEDTKFTYESFKISENIVFIDSELYYYRDNPKSAMNHQISKDNLAIFETYDEIVKDTLFLYPNLHNELYNAYNIRIFEFVTKINKDNQLLLKEISKKARIHIDGMLNSKMITKKNKLLLCLLAYAPSLFWEIYRRKRIN